MGAVTSRAFSGTTRIDIENVNASLGKINSTLEKSVLNSLITLMGYTKSLSDAGDWESPAKDSLCNSFMGMLLDNNNSINNSLAILQNYVVVIIENYKAVERSNMDIFNSLF